MGAVEDANPAPGRQRELRAPEEVVCELRSRGLLERRHRHALGVDSTHDVLDRPVLTGSIEALEDHEQGPPAFRIQAVLELGQALDVSCSPLPGLLLV